MSLPIWFMTPQWETMKYPLQKHIFWAVGQLSLQHLTARANVLCVKVMNCRQWNSTGGLVQGGQVRAVQKQNKKNLPKKKKNKLPLLL